MLDDQSTHRIMRRTFPSISRFLYSMNVVVILLGAVSSPGCEYVNLSSPSSKSESPSIADQADTIPRKPIVLAQGRLLPAEGILQIAALPGSGILSIPVEEGDWVMKGTPLAVLSSEELRQKELEIAKIRLAEATQQAASKKKEADLQVSAAKLRVDQAKTQLDQASASRELLRASQSQIDSASSQIEKLVALRNDPKTRPLVGELELEQKRSELEKAKHSREQALLAADQSVIAAESALQGAELALQVAIDSRDLVDALVPTRSLKAQIDLLESQIAQTRVVAPIDGQILRISAEPGELVSQLPLMEIANLDAMICIAEVPEASVRRIKKDDRVTLESSALENPLTGTVERIGRMVGKPQLELPNPLGKSDFRTVPVRVRISGSDTSKASHWIQLQVDVTIHTTDS